MLPFRVMLDKLRGKYFFVRVCEKYLRLRVDL